MVYQFLSYRGLTAVSRFSGENLFLLDPVVKPLDDNTIWQAVQDLNPDLSVLEADALTIMPVTHKLSAAGAGIEPAQPEGCTN